MERRWSGRRAVPRIPFLVSLSLTAWMLSSQAHAGSVFGTPNALGTRLVFARIADADLQNSRSMVLELTFRGKATFDPSAVSLAVNGLLPCHGVKLGEVSRWKATNQGNVLVIDIGKLYFDLPNSRKQVLFNTYVRSIQSYGGRLVLWARAPLGVLAAHIYSVAASPVRPPLVTWVEIEPSASIVYTSQIRFSFRSDRPEARLQCSVDNGAFETCSSPTTLKFSNGYHRFAVRAVSPEGLAGPAILRWFYVWVTPPAVEITSANPAGEFTASDRMSLAFRFTRDGYAAGLPWFTETSRYAECRIDGGRYVRCGSPVTYINLQEGEHTVDIRRVSYHFYFWMVYSQPVSYTWTIKHQVPTLAWLETPPAFTTDRSARLVYKSNFPAKYQCSLDGTSLGACDTTVLLTDLQDGAHAFEVVAVTDSGAKSLPLTHHWQVDTEAPVLNFSGIVPQQNPTNIANLTASFDASEPADARCAVDGAAAKVCVSPLSLTGLRDGDHSLRITATDRAGNAAAPIEYRWTVDRTLPTLSIEMVEPPRLPTQSTTAKFRFIPSETSTFTCSLDDAEAKPCASELTLTGLAEGERTLTVVPFDIAGNEGAPASFTWVIDRTAPEVQVTGILPSENPTASTSMHFDFESNESGTFSCELDNGGAQPCASPWLLNGLADGEHRVAIRAIDAAGNISAPAAYTWMVSTIANVTLTSVDPKEPATNQNAIRFEFASVDSARFQCSLDGADPTSCVSPVNYSGLADGTHSFEVKALNLVGQPGPAATHTWSIDTRAPVLTITSVRPDWTPTMSGSLDVVFTVDEPGAPSCLLDGGALTPCGSPLQLRQLPDGAHRLEIRASDSVGNVSAPWIYNWTIDSSALVARDTTVLNVTRSMVRVGWRTNFEATSAVEITEQGGSTQTTNATAGYRTEHSVVVNGLKAFTLYTVRGVSVDRDGRRGYSEPIQFRTLR